MNVGYYIATQRAGRTSLLAGPFEVSEHAERWRELALSVAESIDPWVHFDVHSICKVSSPKPLPTGVLNRQLALATLTAA